MTELRQSFPQQELVNYSKKNGKITVFIRFLANFRVFRYFSAMNMDADVIILGGGPAGMMCALTAARRGRKVLIIEGRERLGGKLPISGGGRCNFANRDCDATHYVGQNPRFCTSALARWTVADTLNLLDTHKIPYEERDHGRLFLTGPATQMVTMLETLLRQELVAVRWKTSIESVRFSTKMFHVEHFSGPSRAAALVIATGGVAWPQSGATGIGYQIAESFGLPIITPRPGLVPLRFGPEDQSRLSDLTGVSLTAEVAHAGQRFRDQVLFTHRGLSGPAILQASCTWRPGEIIFIDWLPGCDVLAMLWEQKQRAGAATAVSCLAARLPHRMLEKWAERYLGPSPLAQCSRGQLEAFAQSVHHWPFRPAGTEGLEKAETTIGGVDTRALSSKTMEAKNVPGLYVIGEVMDVAGQLGGYNIHWAFASGHACGLNV